MTALWCPHKQNRFWSIFSNKT